MWSIRLANILFLFLVDASPRKQYPVARFIALTLIEADIVVIGVVLNAGFDASAEAADVSATIKLRRLFKIAVLSRLPLGKSTKNA